ncbi:MAG: DUF1295 domain-containing protein [Bacteroidales bacterium]|nr:DUF1295 domain-containing protein [Bacteroidales bacterium]
MLRENFNIIVIAWIGLALILFPLLLKVRAPYGRHASSKWGPLIDNRAGWFIMEFPSLLLITALFFAGHMTGKSIRWVFFGLWFIHYFNRIFIFPFRTRTKGKKIPLLVVIMALFFNLVNGFLNGYWLGYMEGGSSPVAGGQGDVTWLTDLRLIFGLSLFLTGFIINQLADNHLINLRKDNKSGYSIPKHPLFKHISCPNFAGEIIEWTGFAVMTWSLPALSFAVWTAVNLIPRALHHHAWYKENFPAYPWKRKAVIPFIL